MKKKPIPDWEQKILDLENGYVLRVVFEIDGETVSFYRTEFRRKIVFNWFVNGKWNGTWALKDSETGAKFGKDIYVKPYSTKWLKALKLLDGPREAKKAKAANTRILAGYSCYHNSARTIIQKLRKFKEVKIVENDTT